MLSTLEGELPRTRGPNPLFWTHTLAHLSLAPDHLQLTLPPPHPVHPCRTYCRLSCLLRHSDSFHSQRQTRHIARSVALLPRRASHHSPPFLPARSLRPPPRPPRSILYNYPACITKVAAKLFPPPRETTARPFQFPLANSEPVRLTLFLSSRAPSRPRQRDSSGLFFAPTVALVVSAPLHADTSVF